MANFILSYTDILVSSHTLIEQLESNMILYKGSNKTNQSNVLTHNSLLFSLLIYLLLPLNIKTSQESTNTSLKVSPFQSCEQYLLPF